VIGADFLSAYKIIKAQKAQARALKRFVGKDPDYLVIESSIKAIAMSTNTDILATWTFPNGSKLDIKKADAFDRIKASGIDPDRAQSY
jgi:hypothetical protein